MHEYSREGFPPIFLPESMVEYAPGVNLYRHLQRQPSAKPVLIVPPLGNTEVAIEYFAEKLGLLTLTKFRQQYGAPVTNETNDPVSDRIKEIGVLDSPSMICFPYKVDLGFLIESLAEFAQIRS